MEKSKLINLSGILEIQDRSFSSIEEIDTCEEIIENMKNDNENIVVRDIFYNNYLEIEEPYIIYDSSVGMLIGIGEKEEVIEYYKGHIGGIKGYMDSLKGQQSKGKKIVEKLVNQTNIWKIEKNQKLIDKICNIPKYMYNRMKEYEKSSLELLEVEI